MQPKPKFKLGDKVICKAFDKHNRKGIITEINLCLSDSNKEIYYTVFERTCKLTGIRHEFTSIERSLNTFDGNINDDVVLTADEINDLMIITIEQIEKTKRHLNDLSERFNKLLIEKRNGN